MGGSWSWRAGRAVVVGCFLGAGAVVSSGCSQPVVIDMARNQMLYVDSGYLVTLAADRGAFLAPVIDVRGKEQSTQPVGEDTGLDSEELERDVRWMGDGYWERPLTQQVDELLRRELFDSEVVAELGDAPPPAAADVLLQVRLIRARAGRVEQVEGRQHLADVALGLKVYAPADDGGRRTLLLDEQFQQSVGSSIGMQPPTLPAMMGRAMQGVIHQLLTRLDESNVTRSGLPMQLGTDGEDR